MITSADNTKLKQWRKLARRGDRDREGVFVAEGEDLLAAADAAGWEPVWRLCAAGSGLPGEEVDRPLMDAASALGSGTRCAAAYEQRWSQPVGPLCVYLDGVGDPGNVGAVLRSAHAFGASCVALGPGSADPFSPKAVRASMGAIFSVPVSRCAPDDLPGQRLGLDGAAEEVIAGVEGEVSLLVGAERAGLSPAAAAACTRTVRIPIVQGDSLNAAMAATVALYELGRRMAGA